MIILIGTLTYIYSTTFRLYYLNATIEKDNTKNLVSQVHRLKLQIK